MGARKVPFDTHISNDEFHPNAAVAAKHADRKALEAARNYYAGEVRRLEAIPMPSWQHEQSLVWGRECLADVERRIKEHDEKEGA